MFRLAGVAEKHITTVIMNVTRINYKYINKLD